jgi:hypothetical protein
MLRAGRENAKKRGGGNSSTMTRGTTTAPMAAEKGASEKLRRYNQIYSRVTK